MKYMRKEKAKLRGKYFVHHRPTIWPGSDARCMNNNARAKGETVDRERSRANLGVSGTTCFWICTK